METQLWKFYFVFVLTIWNQFASFLPFLLLLPIVLALLAALFRLALGPLDALFGQRSQYIPRLRQTYNLRAVRAEFTMHFSGLQSARPAVGPWLDRKGWRRFFGKSRRKTGPTVASQSSGDRAKMDRGCCG